MRTLAARMLAAAAFVAALTVVGRATTVIAPTFDELVSQAQVVFEGDTLNVQSRWVTAGVDRAIVTDVTFKVVRTLKGTLGPQTLLTFLGGTVGEDRMVVTGVPTVRVGDSVVLFVDERGRPASPVVGFMHGRFRIVDDPASGRQAVTRFNHEPLVAVSDLGPQAARATARVPVSRAMSLRAFEDTITEAVRRTPGRQ